MTAKQVEAKAKAYEEEELRLLEHKTSQYTFRAKIVSSVFFFLHFILIASLIIFGSHYIPVSEGLIAYWIFLGIGFLFYTGLMVYYWFKGDYRDPLVNRVADFLTKSHLDKRCIKSLKANIKERKEFMKFYELYQSDEDFKQAYLKQSMSKEEEQKEFMLKLVKGE